MIFMSPFIISLRLFQMMIWSFKWMVLMPLSLTSLDTLLHLSHLPTKSFPSFKISLTFFHSAITKLLPERKKTHMSIESLIHNYLMYLFLILPYPFNEEFLKINLYLITSTLIHSLTHSTQTICSTLSRKWPHGNHQ